MKHRNPASAGRKRLLQIGLTAISLLASPALPQDLRQPSSTQPDLNPKHIPVSGPTHVQAQNVTIQVMPGTQVVVKSVDGMILATHENQHVSLDDPHSMRIDLLSAQTSISSRALTTLLNGYALPRAHTSIREMVVTFIKGEVHVTGKIHRIVDIPFSAEGNATVTPEGSLRVHFSRITAAGFMHEKMLDFFGIHLADVAGPRRGNTFQVVDDDVIFPIHALFPAPHFTGKLSSISIEGDELVQTFGRPAPFPPPPVAAERYIYLRGGVLDFGRLSMHGVDLELLNRQQNAPLVFSINRLFSAILAGYLRSLPDRGLVAYIESYEKIGAAK